MIKVNIRNNWRLKLEVNGEQFSLWNNAEDLINDLIFDEDAEEFYVSDRPLRGAYFELTNKKTDSGSDSEVYLTLNREEVWLCRDGVKSVFGKIPNKIYVRLSSRPKKS